MTDRGFCGTTFAKISTNNKRRGSEVTNQLTVPPVTLANFAINSQPINCFNFFALSLSASAGIKCY